MQNSISLPNQGDSAVCRASNTAQAAIPPPAKQYGAASRLGDGHGGDADDRHRAAGGARVNRQLHRHHRLAVHEFALLAGIGTASSRCSRKGRVLAEFLVMQSRHQLSCMMYGTTSSLISHATYSRDGGVIRSASQLKPTHIAWSHSGELLRFHKDRGSYCQEGPAPTDAPYSAPAPRQRHRRSRTAASAARLQ